MEMAGFKGRYHDQEGGSPRAVKGDQQQRGVSNGCNHDWFQEERILRGMELRDEDGIRTGARRFYVQLKRDEDSGQLIHLPSTIQLGSIRAHTFRTCPESYANRARKLSPKDRVEDKFESSGSQSAGDIPRVVDTVGGSQLAVDDMEEVVAQREWGKVSLATSTIAMITADHLSCSSQESLEVFDHCVDTMAVQPTPTPISRLGSTKECRDMLADLSNLERDTNQDVTIEEGCCPPKDKGLRTPALVSPLTCASSDLLLPRKRSQETSTDSSTNSLEADKWLHLQTNSLPFLDSGGLTSFSEITQMKNKEVEGIQNECCDAWKTQKKKKKKERSIPLSIMGLDLEKAFDSISHQYLKGEAQPLHSGCADPCEFPKCGNLDCIICGSGGLRSRSPLIVKCSKTNASSSKAFAVLLKVLCVTPLLAFSATPCKASGVAVTAVCSVRRKSQLSRGSGHGPARVVCSPL
ncbi:hypothetical protein Q8A73_013168 [Channa argus]|nr:hypothetical protein Q8A73_013168 [Channa argus]